MQNDQNAKNTHPKYVNKWPERLIAKPKNANKCQKVRFEHVFYIGLHSWVLQSAPPAIYLHIWGACVLRCFECWSCYSRPWLVWADADTVNVISNAVKVVLMFLGEG